MRILRIVTLVLVMTATSWVSAQTPTPNPETIMQDCLQVLSPDRPNDSEPDAPRIKIVSPVSGTTIRSSEDPFATVNFLVETQNFDLPGTDEDESQRHWHLWLNNGVWGMYYQNEVIGHIPYGTWRVCAVMSDAEHIDLGMPDAILLKVERMESGETIAIPPTPPSGISGIAIIAAVSVGLVVVGVGYWLGVRKS